MGQVLVVGDPVVTLTDETDYIEDGALIVDDRTIVASGRREDLEARLARSTASSGRLTTW